MRIIIVGLGSIARKHISALNSLSEKLDIFALRSGKNKVVNDIDANNVCNIYSMSELPKDFDFVIISNPTVNHLNAIENFLPYNKPIFVEKPPVSSLKDLDKLEVLLQRNKNSTIYAAFNMRFHPIIKWIKSNIDVKEVLEFNVYYGNYLPKWRPKVDYRKVYSAQSQLGGGVHLDLIHELDYTVYILGFPEKFNRFYSRVSQLEIDSFDCAKYWLEYESYNASVQVNYYRKEPKRTIEIVGTSGVYTADFLTGKITFNDQLVLQAEEGILMTYMDQMNYFLENISNDRKRLHNFHEFSELLKLVF